MFLAFSSVRFLGRVPFHSLRLSFTLPHPKQTSQQPSGRRCFGCARMSSRLLIECVTHELRLMFRGLSVISLWHEKKSSVITQLEFLNSLHIWENSKFCSGNTSEYIFRYILNCYPQEKSIINVCIYTCNERETRVFLTS